LCAKLSAVIRYDHLETKQLTKFGNGFAHMPGSNDQELGFSQEWFQIDIHFPSTNANAAFILGF
jgi:hypothetical protein